MLKQDIKAEIDFFNGLRERGGLESSIFSNKTYKFFFSEVNPYLKGSTLEAGCGSGNFGLEILRYNKNKKLSLTGIDINNNLLIDSKKLEIYNKIICGDLNNKSIFKNESFETIIAAFVIHHFQDFYPIIDNFYYWLKPGGFLIILEPNGSNPVLKVSYFIRKVLSKFINIPDSFSINESHKTIIELQKSLNKFEVYNIETFNPILGYKHRLFNFIIFLSLIRAIVLKIYQFFSFSKLKGNALIIIAKKI